MVKKTWTVRYGLNGEEFVQYKASSEAETLEKFRRYHPGRQVATVYPGY